MKLYRETTKTIPLVKYHDGSLYVTDAPLPEDTNLRSAIGGEMIGFAPDPQAEIDAKIGESFTKNGKRGGQVKHQKAQKEYAAIRKDYAHVSLLLPSVTKKEKMRLAAKHKNVSVSKVRDALKEK
jgi:hypothetical protein